MKRFYRVTAAVLAAICSIPPVSLSADTRLPDGFRFSATLTQRISSETAKVGDVVPFEVLEDVVLDGRVIIKQGTAVRGVVVEAQAKRRMGRAGKLSYALVETKTVDRQTIRLRAVAKSTSGDSKVTSTAVATGAVAVFVPIAAPFVLLRKGKDIVVDQGTRIDAFVDGDHALELPEPPPQAAPAAAAAAATGPRLTNSDIVALKKAGFGDSVILAKIASSAPDFSLDSTDLVLLKKAGVSDQIIAAMIGKQQN